MEYKTLINKCAHFVIIICIGIGIRKYSLQHGSAPSGCCRDRLLLLSFM